MPKTFPVLPRVGEAIEVVGHGTFTVTHIEYDADGDPHLHLQDERGTSQD